MSNPSVQTRAVVHPGKSLMEATLKGIERLSIAIAEQQALEEPRGNDVLIIQSDSPRRPVKQGIVRPCHLLFLRLRNP